MNVPISTELLLAIRNLLNQTRAQLQQTVNHTMVKTYWEIGRLIVEEEQKGEKEQPMANLRLKL